MSDVIDLLPGIRAEAERPPATGVLPSQWLRRMIASGEVQAFPPYEAIHRAQVQPASIDLRLGNTAYRVNASFLPGKARVADRLRDLALYQFPLNDGAVLERECVYIVPLQERLRLRSRMTATMNPKSSIGRLDIFARVITDNGTQFDGVTGPYDGPLYAEIVPRTFSVRVRAGSRLVQVRIRYGSPITSDKSHRQLLQRREVVAAAGEDDIRDASISFRVDVNGSGPGSVIGYKARHLSGLIDVDTVGGYDPRDFWEPVYSRNGKGLILDPRDFYILASKEAVNVPINQAAEMIAYDTLVGEFRVHYAGFFDPGFGCSETGGTGTKAVLEVRSHDVPFLVEDGQVVGRLAYEPLAEVPDILYGAQVGSYQRQHLALAKQFRAWGEEKPALAITHDTDLPPVGTSTLDLNLTG
jgi:dCTP deaminase